MVLTVCLLGFPGGAVVKKALANAENIRDPGLNPRVGKICWRRKCNHSTILAWKIPWTEEPGRLQSMGSQRVRHDWASVPALLSVLFMTGCWILTKTFYALIDINMWLLFFILLMRCIIDFMDIRSYLHAWGRFYLIMVYCSFNMSLNSVC